MRITGPRQVFQLDGTSFFSYEQTIVSIKDMSFCETTNLSTITLLASTEMLVSVSVPFFGLDNCF